MTIPRYRVSVGTVVLCCVIVVALVALMTWNGASQVAINRAALVLTCFYLLVFFEMGGIRRGPLMQVTVHAIPETWTYVFTLPCRQYDTVFVELVQGEFTNQGGLVVGISATTGINDIEICAVLRRGRRGRIGPDCVKVRPPHNGEWAVFVQSSRIAGKAKLRGWSGICLSKLSERRTEADGMLSQNSG